jgi:predicted nucleic acid-binding protein
VRYVVDATVVIQLGLAGGNLGPLEGHELVAPPILASEFTSCISDLTYRGEIPLDAAQRAVEALTSYGIWLERPKGLHKRAWSVAQELGWPKTYAAEYVALALLMRSPLVTIDARLRRGAGHLIDIPLVTDIAPLT